MIITYNYNLMHCRYQTLLMVAWCI